MSGSIFKEVSLTPYIFDVNHIFTNKKRYIKLISILESLIDSGIIISVSSTWKDQVFDFVEKYNEEDKDDIISLLKEIDTREKISSYPSNTVYNNENGWIEKITELNQKREFDFVVATKEIGIMQLIESVNREKYINTGAKVDKQTFIYMEKMLAPVLAYADIVKVIDPYFRLTNYRGEIETRYMDVLQIICEHLGNSHGKRNNAIIEIYTSVKSMLNNEQPREFVWNEIEKWKKIINNFEKKYGHKIIITIWEEIKRKDEWHERWIITNQCGIFIGKGSDISNWTDSTWGLMDWNELPKISNNFNRNRHVYNYIGEITSDNFFKNMNPKNTPIFMTKEEQKKQREQLKQDAIKAEEERLRKLNNPKKLQRRLVPLSERNK